MASKDPLALPTLISHVKDSKDFHVAKMFGEHVYISQPYSGKPLHEGGVDLGSGNFIEPFDLQITRFMIVEVLVAIIMIGLFLLLAGKIKNGRIPKGRIWNFFEVMLLFVRDQVARPAIGKHDADQFVPFLWTLFFFVLGCNLMGMIPWMGSPTGALATTGALAFGVFFIVVRSGMKKLGGVGFWKAQVPHMDVPGVMGIIIKVMVFVIEVLGLLIKHFVLAIRLLANMAAGHLVLAVLIGFVAAIAQNTGSWFLFSSVSGASVFGAVAISMLELFVAFLQAYIFTFLSALFIGMAVHPH